MCVCVFGPTYQDHPASIWMLYVGNTDLDISAILYIQHMTVKCPSTATSTYSSVYVIFNHI